ncbi:helix-turn-helix domain-containing protein [Salibacter halophilus]|uniref:Helix-turn-helix transcriptional regulator n=1 Tax=Salibacter halophilus TaxID=1803916 RepID=A0A6N6M741_9FLAO|nr:helix-turn-helix transcriptional regulator [Salibacter halophilus]KAB1065742.1 helix-turn-helix transcriptional regulator [Salibacter halophilus]
MITDIGKKIRQIRELKGYSQEFIAKKLDLSIRAYSKIESEETQLTIKRLNEISEILEVEPEEILGFDSQFVFNNNFKTHKGGSYVAYNNTSIEQVQILYEKLLAEKDRHIELLQKQVKDREVV